MGGGGLQLLGHKRWHVWRRDARERVERDERLQEQQQREEAARRRLAEQEQRVASLLKRSRDEGQGGGEDGLEGQREHVNLFRKEEEEHAEALDRGRDAGGRKSDRQSDTLGRHGRLPWYAQSGRALGEADGGAGQERERKRVRELSRADPLQHMRPARRDSEEDDDAVDSTGRGAARKRRRLGGSDRRRYASQYVEDESDSDSSSSDSERGRRLSGGKAKRRRRKREKEGKSSREALMNKLRREREAREEKERRRADELLAGR